MAVKIVNKKKMKTREMELQRNEIQILKICQHPNIIRLVDVFETFEEYYLVLEYLQGGDLFDYLKSRDFNISEDQQRKFLGELTHAMKFLHDKGIIHRDLKLENVMMTTDHDTKASTKLVDFGLSIILGPGQQKCEVYGTQGYIAPEMFMKQPYYKEVDCWSLGVLFYAILSGFMPFEHNDMEKLYEIDTLDIVSFTPSKFDGICAEVKDLIINLLRVKP